METVSVDEAIAKGRRMIVIPCVLILFGPAIITYMLNRSPYAIMLAPMTLLLGAIIAAIYRARAIPKWKIWAFSRVRNVHELKRRAAYAWVIPSDENAGIRKFENWTAIQKQQWEQLQRKFDVEDHFIDDTAVGHEIKVYYAWYKKLLFLVFSILMIGFASLPFIFQKAGPITFSKAWGYLMSVFFTICGGYLGWISFKQLLNRKVQLTINEKGVETATYGFHHWSKINGLLFQMAN